MQSTTDGQSSLTTDAAHSLEAALFDAPEARVFAVIDGASMPGLRAAFVEHDVDHRCLFRGTLDPALEDVAPWLAEVELGSDFLRWLLLIGWGRHFGIFLTTTVEDRPLRRLRIHLRTFLQVNGADGRLRLFRYYDPRVLIPFLIASAPHQSAHVFGDVVGSYVAEDREGNALRFERVAGNVSSRVMWQRDASAMSKPMPNAGAGLR